MPIDPTILGQVQPVQVGTPQQWEGEMLTLRQMTNRAEMQESDLEVRRQQLQAEAADRRENQEMQQHLAANDFDIDDSFDGLLRINRDKAFAAQSQFQEMYAGKRQSFKENLDNERARSDAIADVVGAFTQKFPDNPGAWQEMIHEVAKIDKEAAADIPRAHDPEWVEQRMALGLTEEERLDAGEKALTNMLDGKFDQGSAGMLMHSTDREDYEEDKQVLRELGVPASVLRSFPDWPMDAGQGLPRDDPRAEQFMADLEARTMTTLDRAKLEADQARQAQAADVEAGRAGREQQRIDVSGRQAAVAERRVAVSEEAAVTQAAGAAGADVRGTGEAANRFRVASSAAVEAKGEALTAAENWQVYKDTVIGADDKTLTGRKPLTANELSNIEKWRYDELSELEPPPDATWMDPDEFQAATIAYDADRPRRQRVNETYQRRLNGGPPPPKRAKGGASVKKIWTMSSSQQKAVEEALRQGGARVNPDNMQKFLHGNPAFRQSLGLKEHRK